MSPRIIICEKCAEKKLHHAKGLCHRCYNAIPEIKEKRDAFIRRYDREHCEEHKIYRREYNAQLRREAIEAYGGKCECCGEDRNEFLTLDHINGRKPGDRIGGVILYRKLKRQGWPKNGLRLLCWNCNCSIGFFGHCPHQQKEVSIA